MQIRRLIPSDPVNLSVKGKLLSVIACFSAILATAWLTQHFILTAQPILVASMGASAVIVFIIPNSPLAQPWPLVGSHLISTSLGIACTQLLPDKIYAAAFAVSISVLAMFLLRCLHPPGAAAALAPVMGGETVTNMGYQYVLMPVGLNVAVMLLMSLLLNRWLLQHTYPTKSSLTDKKSTSPDRQNKTVSINQINEQDLAKALHDTDTFVDITANELSKLLAEAQRLSFARTHQPLTCADLMASDLASVEYGTTVDEAWKKMHREGLNALPVLDKAKRIIGIITWHDFFRHIKSDNKQTFKEKLQAFLQPSTEISTAKPESVGHLMTTPVTYLPESAPIADLIPLMLGQGYQQIPIVNGEARLVGMIYQTTLMGALYNLTVVDFAKS